MSIKPSLKKRQAGQAAVEFVLILVFLVVFLLSFVEITALVYTYSVLAGSAKEGVRYGIVHGTLSTTCSGPGAPGIPCDAGAAGLKGVVANFARGSLNNTAGMTVTPTYPDGVSTPSSRVRVVVSYSYQPLFGLGWPTVTVNAASEGRIAF
ncbi:MAG TPA: TadE/TadG family type IV pilus assembly protein [Anaerolineales bacterium]